MDNNVTPQGKDPQLWNLARRRASFKSHLLTYLLVNAGLWAIWFANGSHTYGSRFPWPVWSMLGWGIGLVSHYLSAYTTTGANAVDREYEKLTRKQSQ